MGRKGSFSLCIRMNGLIAKYQESMSLSQERQQQEKKRIYEDFQESTLIIIHCSMSRGFPCFSELYLFAAYTTAGYYIPPLLILLQECLAARRCNCCWHFIG